MTIRAFHASGLPSILEFLPLTHFGTQAAATHRAQAKHADRSFLYEVELDIRKTLVVPDLSNQIRSGQHHWMRLVDQLHYDLRPKALTTAERNAVFAAGRGGSPTLDRQADACLAGILVAKGIDALAYENDFEDAGSTSWILMAPERSRIVEITEMSQPTAKLSMRP